jgi:hypothetical protein
MARNGSGQYNLVNNTWFPAINGVLATAADWEALIQDIASALTQSVSRDGQSPMTGNLPMGGNVLTGLGAGSAVGQSLRWEQLFSQGTETDIASAATTDIGAQNSNFLRVTGTTTITSLGTNYRGPRFLRFESAVTLTNGANLILQGGANYTTTAGDILIAIPKATLGVADGWCVVIPGLIPNGSVTTAKIADNAITSAKIAAGAVLPVDLANGGAELGPRNRIINGDMRIDQRNNGNSVSLNNSFAYTIDRWGVAAFGGGVVSVQRVTDAPSGFTNSLSITVTTADSSIGASDNYQILQAIEGFNTADLAFGTASARTLTISFWVKSSLTGTHSGCLLNGSNNRSYVFTFAVSAANTWEYKTVTIPGDTSGTWATDNTTGISLRFNLGGGSSYQGTPGSWTATDDYAATGAVQIIGTNGATLLLTGVQLEAGSVATPFERRDYGRELIMCQRYFQVSGMGYGLAFNSVTISMTYPLLAVMRAAPSVALVNGTTALVRLGASGESITSIQSTFTGQTQFVGVNAGGSGYTVNASYAALSQGHFSFSAEL